MIFSTIAFYGIIAAAEFSITDPSNVIDPADWTADNALLADYNITPTLYQTNAIEGAHVYSDQNATISRQYLTVEANDTSVLVISNGSIASISNTEIVKFGHGSNLFQESFYGLNAAVNIANQSTATLQDINVTVHNGAANIFAYGDGTVVNVDNAFLYSSGPVSHGIYAAGNATVYAKNIRHYSGGNRASSFSGDNPAGYVHVTNAVAHTDGVGSAICYALGVCNMTNVIGHASNAPVTFSDSKQTTIWKDSDLTAGLLAGVVLFSSMTRSTGASVTFDHSKLTVLGETMPGIWFGNVIGEANIISSSVNVSASGILAVANYSQVTQAFDYFAGYADNNNLQPAELTINVQDSDVEGSLIAYNGSSIAFNLEEYSTWTGDASCGYADCFIGVALSSNSNWTLSANTALTNFTYEDATFANVDSNGFNITYNSSSYSNTALGGRTHSLPGGGYLVPSNMTTSQTAATSRIKGRAVSRP